MSIAEEALVQTDHAQSNGHDNKHHQAEFEALLQALISLRKGEFAVRLPHSWTGLSGKVADTFNDVMDQLEGMTGEVDRISHVVGKQGKLKERASTGQLRGSWAGTIDSVNALISDLAHPTSEMARVVGAIAKGDLSQSMALDMNGRPLEGEFLRTARTVNRMVEQLGSFSSEVTRVAREVGTEGKLGGQAAVKGVAGTWKDLTDSVNSMASNLTAQVRNIADVTTAVATGDLSKKITVDVRGEFLELKDTINTMVDQLRSFASEVTRVAREVGTEGKLGGQADVKGVAGTWKDLTDNVNFMASNLTSQVRNIAEVTTAVANGDLSKKIEVNVRGEILELKNTINTMVDQLRAFASEVTRVAREVGTEGKLGGQADVKGVAGTWKDLTDNVNFMAGNLTSQVRNIAEVTKAVANGNLSKKITVDVKGEILELKNTVNTMVDQLSSFASEVTRVAREVGTDGRLGGQADVKGVAGTWKDLTDSVNSMAGNLTDQVRNIADVTTAVARGDLSKKITVDVRGEILELKNTINTMVDQLRSFASEVTRVAREVGTQGQLGGQADVRGVEGTWKDLTDSVNSMAGNLTDQVRNIAEVTTAVATGDLSKKITVDVRGEILELKNTINTMVDQLRAFASEVTRVAREVGTEGKLGGQASVPGVSGTWKDLTDNVNFMAGNLTSQVRGIARVVTAVANGDLKQKLTVEAKGEIAALADTINGMIDTLATFADQVTTVAREVGVEGKLGGQASVPGAAGTWKDLTDNVNQLAANLTTQVRAIAEVATAVTKGDLTRSIKVEALGEVAALKDNINEMIVNLKDTTLKNAEQDWLKTNLAKFSRMLQGQKDMITVGRLILSELAPLVSAYQAAMYTLDTSTEPPSLMLLASYAFDKPGHAGKQYELGHGLVGQCAVEKQKILLDKVPSDYIRVSSGLGAAVPANLMVLPILFEGHVKAVLELASFERFSSTHQAFLDQLTESIGIVINTIEANMRTEDLLKQSQSLAHELQSRQEELQQTNQQLKEKALLLAHQNVEVERKNQEVEHARQALEEKAEQLALTSRYKSEFLANMSHELRTPLNSLLILSDQLSKNPEGNLTNKQTEYCKTIHSSGKDLLTLINDILDLSKIESGTVVLDLGELRFSELHHYVERTFRHVAEAKGVDFLVELDPELDRRLTTDIKRLQQVLKNLLSNAFKFTDRGRVSLKIHRAMPENFSDIDLDGGDDWIAFSVADTGIGISAEKQKIIFEAFQQADGSTSRKYGGTGLGLAISREIARLLGGEIRLASRPGFGSTFSLLLPASFAPPKVVRRTALARVNAPQTESEMLPLEIAAPEEAASDCQPTYRDDRGTIRPDDLTLLVVDNDTSFAELTLEAAHTAGFKCILTSSGAEAVALATDHRPTAVLLDISLPDVDGWRVLRRLKNDVALRHIPVYVVSTVDEPERGLSHGAQGVLGKPIQTRETLDAFLEQVRRHLERPTRKVLVYDQSDALAEELTHLFRETYVEIETTSDPEAFVARAGTDSIDAVVLTCRTTDAPLDARIEETLAELASQGAHQFVYDNSSHTSSQLAHCEQSASELDLPVIGSFSELVERIVEAVCIERSKLPPDCRNLLDDLDNEFRALAGKKVLIVDDDMRNIFALSSILERHDIVTVSAETGRDAINLLHAAPDVDIVLMDIMMPEMDGIDTMRAIRDIPHVTNLPIVAVTAQAMKGDREKCIEAGAWDYLSKPVDSDQLLRTLRAWLRA